MAEEEQQENGPETKNIPGLPKVEQAALSSPAGETDTAVLEARQLSSGLSSNELKKDAEKRDHDRKQRFADHFEGLIRWGMNGAFVAVMAMGAVWVWHLIAPLHLQWMADGQIDHIQNMVTGGVIAVVVGDHFKRRLN